VTHGISFVDTKSAACDSRLTDAWINSVFVASSSVAENLDFYSFLLFELSSRTFLSGQDRSQSHICSIHHDIRTIGSVDNQYSCKQPYCGRNHHFSEEQHQNNHDWSKIHIIMESMVINVWIFLLINSIPTSRQTEEIHVDSYLFGSNEFTLNVWKTFTIWEKIFSNKNNFYFWKLQMYREISQKYWDFLINVCTKNMSNFQTDIKLMKKTKKIAAIHDIT
jgi:hypothetical protein